jgi:hypothetical protein
MSAGWLGLARCAGSSFRTARAHALAALGANGQVTITKRSEKIPALSKKIKNKIRSTKAAKGRQVFEWAE